MKSPFAKQVYQKNAEIYKLMANPIRLEILNILKGKEQSVEKLTSLLKLRKANISQHLAVLRHARLINMRRQGQRVFYSLVDPRIVAPCNIFREMYQ